MTCIAAFAFEEEDIGTCDVRNRRDIRARCRAAALCLAGEEIGKAR